MAPEVIAGLDYGEGADVWSFGVVVWQMYTCQLPYSDMGKVPLIHVLQAVSEGRRPEMVDGKFPPALKALVLMCLDADLHTRCTIHDVGALLARESFVERLLRMEDEEGEGEGRSRSTSTAREDLHNLRVSCRLASRAATATATTTATPPPASTSLARSPLLDIVKVRVPSQKTFPSPPRQRSGRHTHTHTL
jgi:serine/threonine protein kinase